MAKHLALLEKGMAMKEIDLLELGKSLGNALVQAGQVLLEIGTKLQMETRKYCQPLVSDSGNEPLVTAELPLLEEKPTVSGNPKGGIFPRENNGLYEFGKRTPGTIRACKQGNKYFVSVSDACSVIGLCNATASKLYRALPAEYKSKVRVRINNQTLLMNVALQRPLLNQCKKMGYPTAKLGKYLNRGGRELVVAELTNL